MELGRHGSPHEHRHRRKRPDAPLMDEAHARPTSRRATRQTYLGRPNAKEPYAPPPPPRQASRPLKSEFGVEHLSGLTLLVEIVDAVPVRRYGRA